MNELDISFRRVPEREQWRGSRLRGIELDEERLDAKAKKRAQPHDPHLARREYEETLQRAKAHFSDRWAPLAASAYLMARTTGAEPTVGQLKSHLAATYEGYEA